MSAEETSHGASPARLDEPPSWTAATNWNVAGGSLTDSVTLESFFCLVEEGGDVDAKPPLILCPASPDCSPPEITITFSRKHEIRQVYLRSTARVYEMYYTEKFGSCNEYLSTVRCGMATREGRVLQAVSDEESVLSHQGYSNKELDGDALRNVTESAQNEDSWVEVMAIDSSLSSKGSSFSLDECDVGICRTPQDLYEAAAEIADMKPCLSLTIKLLSLVKKPCVYIDELYVFADPISEDSLEKQPDDAESTSSNSLMTMLLPAIMQFSMSGASGLDRIKRESENKRVEAVLSEEDIQEKASTTVALESSGQPDSVAQPAPSCSVDTPGRKEPEAQPECMMNQLVSRINRVEDILLRFEERVLAPISRIDERLGRVENQLESLTKRLPSSPISYTRIYAPDFSCGESESNSFYNAGSPESQILEEQSESAGDHPEEPRKETPDQRKHISIDDALAFAFEGFLISSKKTNGSDSSSPADKAPELSLDEGMKGRKSVPWDLEAHKAIELTEESFCQKGNRPDNTDECRDCFSFSDDPFPGGIYSDNSMEAVNSLEIKPPKDNIAPQDIIDGIIGVRSATSAGTPIPEVNFAPKDKLNLKSSLEELLSGTSDLRGEQETGDEKEESGTSFPEVRLMQTESGGGGALFDYYGVSGSSGDTLHEVSIL